MTKRDIYRQGYSQGFAIASWQDLIIQGKQVPYTVTWSHYGTITTSLEAREVFYKLCYTEFDTMADALYKVLKTLQETRQYNVFSVYSCGIVRGIRANYTSRINRLQASL
jgi:hypothetical protein